MRSKTPCIEPNAIDPLRNETRVLACRHAVFGTTVTREQELAGFLVGSLEIIINRLAGLFAQFKSDWLSGLLLSYCCASRRVSALGDILDFDRDDVTAAKLAVDCQIEHGKIANATLDLEFRPDRPDMFRAQRRLCPSQLTLVPGPVPDRSTHREIVYVSTPSLRGGTIIGSPHALKRIDRLDVVFWSRWEIGDVRSEVQSGKHLLALSFSAFDPSRKSATSRHFVLDHQTPTTLQASHDQARSGPARSSSLSLKPVPALAALILHIDIFT
jgi:hypothetical protein